jgi:hypothetical protein
MYASRRVLKPEGAMKVKLVDTGPCLYGRSTVAPFALHVSGAAVERTRWDPKDGELCLSRAKPEETLVEARNGSDVQIDRQTWV